jgi:DNA-binding MarR family transcriptional regulator
MSTTDVKRALAALELTAIQHRHATRRRLRVGDDELSALLYLAHHGAVPQGRLADVTALSRSGAGAMVQRLEDHGYVERRTDPADRRLRVVELSAAGRTLLGCDDPAFTARIERLLADHDADVVAALGRFIAGLAEDRDQASPDTAAVDPIWRAWG